MTNGSSFLLSTCCGTWILVPQLFKEEFSPMKDGVKLVNDLAHQLAISDVHLSMENSRALEQINIRWKQLQVKEKPKVSYGRKIRYNQA